MYHQIFTSVKIVSPMPARAGNFARTFRRTFRRRLWRQGPIRYDGGCSYGISQKSGIIRFSHRSKSCRRCRHAPETSHGRSDGRSDAGYGGRVRLGTVGEAPHCGSRTPDLAVFLVPDFQPCLCIIRFSHRRNRATQTPAGDRRLRYREGAGTCYGTQETASRYLEEKIFSSNRPRRPAEARRQDPALARATRAGR